MKKMLDFVVFLFTGKGDYTKDTVDAGLVSYEGQGRNKYGN